MSTEQITPAARTHLRENANAYAALTTTGDIITAWQDEEATWHATRPVSEDDGPWGDLPEHVRRSLTIQADGDPESADLDRILWADTDSPALADVAAERRTHDARGWTARHDDEHGVHHLVGLTLRKLHEAAPITHGLYSRQQLVKAAALLLAAIDRFDRAEVSRG
ncbi:hypothetical protein [Cellulomonas iranensis]|uniref:hypothetical protein n=1 Tax=Cellulomonas iranensis TaxID=76862 RepID=UPI0013D7E472|nr:hypothetical protein [Cellulomonas iranensis]